MKIVYLYSELMGYQIPILKEYVATYNAEVHVVHWDQKKLTPYVPPVIAGIHYYNRSAFNRKELVKFVGDLNPDIVYISGWMDKDYLAVVRPLKKKGTPIVSGFDSIYKKTLKQRIAILLFPFLKNIFFSHVWVAGPYQFEYAKRLGFENNQIIFNCYSADIDVFNKAFVASAKSKKKKYPHRFLFVGRFELVKGIDLLLEAWHNIQNERKDWELCLIGNGSLFDDVSKDSSITTLAFMSPEKLANEIQHSGCYVLPSRDEPWALVLHEFSAAGLPIICSDVCGAAPVFVIPQYNGYTFNANEVKAIEDKLLKIIHSPDEKLVAMSENSHLCGQKITPEMTAAVFMSVLDTAL